MTLIGTERGTEPVRQVALATGAPGAAPNPVSTINPMPIRSVDPTYQLALTLASLAAGAFTGTTTGIQGGAYIWDAVLTGTSPQLFLDVLASDGATWVPLTSLTVSGQKGIVLGSNATVRLRNGGSNAITNLSSSLT